ncbi:MAG: 4Fe-4S binding protein [Oscillospiraceae bacterium]|nr:4Fe-4S binding protein [Oscillospiraceae bacterium]
MAVNYRNRRICEKKCPVGAIKGENNHAAKNHDLCTNCGECMKACPAEITHDWVR